MKVEVFAILKDHFDKEFEITENINDVASLKSYLIDIKAASAGILSRCRFAIQDEFVEDHHPLEKTDTVIIIPPSSGG